MAYREELAQVIKRLKELNVDFGNRDYLLTWELSDAEVETVFYVAKALELLYQNNISCRVFNGGLAVSNFRDKSTRTRFSFASAASMLGLSCQDLDESKSQVSHGETVRETANMISFLTDCIGIRDDLFIYEGHAYQAEVAEAITEGYDKGVLPARPVVVNLQCDQDHPTQSMADLLHLAKHFGGLDKLKGKKIAVSWAYSPAYGKPLSVPQSLITLMTRFGMNVTLAHPEGYDLIPSVVEQAEKFASQSGGSFTKCESMKEAFQDADVVYPKSWASFEVMEKRRDLLHKGQAGAAEMSALEKECIANNAKFKDWVCDAEKMAVTKDGNALYCHCLPADINDVNCTDGEVTAEVFEKYRLRTYAEAGHKPYVIASAIMLGRLGKDTADTLAMLGDAAIPRAGVRT